MPAYYVHTEEPTKVMFRVGNRKSAKKDVHVATAVDEDNAIVLVTQANVYFDCECGVAEDLEKEVMGAGDE